MEEVLGNLSKYLLRNKSLQLPITVAYDFEIIIDDQSKLEELRGKKDKSYTIKTDKHIPVGFALAIQYSEDIKCKKREYFCNRGRDFLLTLLKRWIKS